MSEGAPAYVPNRRDVARESFEDEVILIHFPSGKYFRLDAAGRVAWASVERGATSAVVAAALRAGFDVEEAAARSDAETFLASLAAHGLVVADASAGAAAASANGAPHANGADRAPYRPPTLEVFTDLEQLFLVDPIHDVDASGWPHAKP